VRRLSISGLAAAACLLAPAVACAAEPAVPTFTPVPPAPAQIVLRPQQLTAPSCATARDCLLLGTRGHTPVLGGYDGRRLRVVSRAPAQADTVSCPTTRLCMFTGPQLIGGRRVPIRSWSRSGTRWRSHAMPQPPRREPTAKLDRARHVDEYWYLDALSCGSARSCAAVGQGWAYGVDDLHPPRGLIERWDGRRWHLDRLADPIGALTSVSCPTAGVCMAVGETADGLDHYIAPPELLMHGHWVARRLPEIPGARYAEVGSVSCASVSRCVAVGQLVTRPTPGDPPHDEAVVAVWNGSAWRAQALPLLAGVPDELLADVSCPPGRATTCIATGRWGTDTSAQGGAFVAAIPATGAVTQQEQQLPILEDLQLDCPTEAFCMVNAPNWPLRTG
jgi:hypothetical protein